MEIRLRGRTGRAALFNLMSFLNCTKYPPSLLFLLMTLGPAFLLLAFLDGASDGKWRAARIFGSVPLFYYLLHLPLLHGAAVLLSCLQYGSAAWLLRGPIFLSAMTKSLPAGYGYGLLVVYGVWIGSVVLLYRSVVGMPV
jgi:uncharacterized membrane protein